MKGLSVRVIRPGKFEWNYGRVRAFFGDVKTLLGSNG